MKKTFLCTSVLFLFCLENLASAKVAPQTMTITEKALTRCYQQYPFFLEAIGLISDKDFRDAEKSQKRLMKIQKLVKRSKSEAVRDCLEKIVLASKSSNDFSSFNYVKDRMSEIESVVNAPVNLVNGYEDDDRQ